MRTIFFLVSGWDDFPLFYYLLRFCTEILAPFLDELIFPWLFFIEAFPSVLDLFWELTSLIFESLGGTPLTHSILTNLFHEKSNRGSSENFVKFNNQKIPANFSDHPQSSLITIYKGKNLFREFRWKSDIDVEQ